MDSYPSTSILRGVAAWEGYIHTGVYMLLKDFDWVCNFIQMAAVRVGGKYEVYSSEKLEAILARIKT